MNENEIRNMKAGRELDALVVTHIFDLVWWRRGQRGQWIALPEHDTEIPDYWIRDVPTKLTEDDLSEAVPHYSTDIAAAWQVVEKMIGGEYEISMANREDREGYSFWGVDFYTMIDEAALDACFSADALTAPLAICRAALLAVLVEEQ